MAFFMPEETFLLQSRRLARSRRVQTVQHLAGAVMLISTAITHLTDPHSHHVVLPVLELLAGGGLIGATIVEKVRKTHPRVGWVELAGSVMMFVEAFAKLEQPHKVAFYILSFIPPIMLLIFGLFDARIRQSLYMRADDERFEMKLRVVLPSKKVAWEGLRSYRVTAKALELHHGDGDIRRLSLRDVKNREEAVAWAVTQFERRGLVSA
jgi:hypothetical protein